ncbi:MAG: hypothetical protein HY984_00575 [Candidatus Magasanikbacteria bacterium]|nr:hypothetical protein [Candidatus Magasanikbacteria bacterium]
MNLYEFEGKKLFEKHGIAAPRGVVVRRGDDGRAAYDALSVTEVVVKAQVLSGKRGKNNGIKFCSTAEATAEAVREIFSMNIRGQYVAAVRIEEKLDIVAEHYLSITYDTNARQPMLIYSREGGVDIEEVPESRIQKIKLNLHPELRSREMQNEIIDSDIPYASELWRCFLAEDCRVVEINPLVKTRDGRWIAADAKVALDDDAFFRHGSTNSPPATDWSEFEPRTMMGRLPTEREIAVKKIDEGEKYYQGTAGKYIEMAGDIAILFSGGGASIANMDALINAGLKPANYTEYSGNPPREKVYALAKIVLSKPGLRGLWIAGGVANFTNIAETFHGIVDALDEIKPTYPIVIRRAGPNEEEGMRLVRECGERNGLRLKLFGKETSMSETAGVLAGMLR